MPTRAPVTSAADAGVTERIDVIACLDERNRRRATEPKAAEPGRYLEVQGAGETLLVPLRQGVIHVGRGLSADLHLDEGSVSRRHAILVHRSMGARILDDRSANGTLVNGRRVSQADLRSGDMIVLGRVVLRYLEVPAPAGSRAQTVIR
ncbi:MAG TPA: FHA domain-containing protein [Solirubrobacteraceae bacterium]|nr:FHA domain-containing protein [Solirubrobacteraceae bacterium]